MSNMLLTLCTCRQKLTSEQWVSACSYWTVFSIPERLFQFRNVIPQMSGDSKNAFLHLWRYFRVHPNPCPSLQAAADSLLGCNRIFTGGLHSVWQHFSATSNFHRCTIRQTAAAAAAKHRWGTCARSAHLSMCWCSSVMMSHRSSYDCQSVCCRHVLLLPLSLMLMSCSFWKKH